MSTTTSTTGKTSKRTAGKKYPDLHKRTREFGSQARMFVSRTPRTLTSLGDCRNLIKASGAIGSSYIEADEAPSREAFLKCIHSCRRDARQSAHWLQLLDANLEERSEEIRQALWQEANELDRIFGAIIGKVINKARAARKTEETEAAA